MKRISRGLLLPLALALGVLAACGDDDDDGQQQPPPPPPPASFTVRIASLDGDQETPAAVDTPAFGAGVLAVDEQTGAVRGFLVTSGLVAATVAHVHLAARGTGGDPIIPLEGGPEVWVVPDRRGPLTAAQLNAFATGNLYFNAHTEANPTGEIRGQLDKPGTVRVTTLNGAQETPPVNDTDAVGAGMLSVNGGSGAVAGFIVARGLVNETAAHVHPGARGASNPPIVPLTGGPDLWVVPDGAPVLAAEHRTAFTAGTLYLNAHTEANPNGEIRGQLDEAGSIRVTTVNGGQETPPVSTGAVGGAVLSVDAATGAVGGFVVHSGIATANQAHVHEQARGTPGVVRVPLAGRPGLWVVPDEAAALSEALRTAFGNGTLYFNVHSPANPNGEIRGQLD